MRAAVVVVAEVQVETVVASAATDDEMEMRSDVSIFLRKGRRGGGGEPSAPLPDAYDHRRDGDDDDDWYARVSANSLVHAVVETRMGTPRRRTCGASSSSSILRCVTTCFADARLRAYSVANDSTSNVKREIVDRGPVLFALPVGDGGVCVPACLLGWRGGDGWIVGVPVPATTRAPDAWWRNGCVLLPFDRLDVAATEFIGCVRAPLLVADSEDAGATRVQLFESPPPPPEKRRHHNNDENNNEPCWWWWWTDAAALATAALLATALLVLMLLEIVVRIRTRRLL